MITHIRPTHTSYVFIILLLLSHLKFTFFSSIFRYLLFVIAYHIQASILLTSGYLSHFLLRFVYFCDTIEWLMSFNIQVLEKKKQKECSDEIILLFLCCFSALARIESQSDCLCDVTNLPCPESTFYACQLVKL